MHSLPIPLSIMGESLELCPLNAADFEALYRVACDPSLWARHPSPTRYQAPVFREWFDDAFLACKKWGGGTDRELKRLMLQHAFQWVDTVWFHVGAQNIRSQRAMEKVCAKFSHTSIKQFAGREQESLFYKVERAAFRGAEL